MSNQEWRAEARCAGSPEPDIFFPEGGDSPRPALSLCDRCPVTQECRAYARKIRAQHGIWGGTERGRDDR